MIRPPPSSTPFPYPTLFRSRRKSLVELRRLAPEAAPNDAPPAERKANVYRRSQAVREYVLQRAKGVCEACGAAAPFIARDGRMRSEEHTAELQSQSNLVCRL